QAHLGGQVHQEARSVQGRAGQLGRGGVGEGRHDLALTERGGIATEQRIRGAPSSLRFLLAVDQGGELPGQLALPSPFLRRSARQRRDLLAREVGEEQEKALDVL